jgi:hypothetical protein
MVACQVIREEAAILEISLEEFLPSLKKTIGGKK